MSGVYSQSCDQRFVAFPPRGFGEMSRSSTENSISFFAT